MNEKSILIRNKCLHNIDNNAINSLASNITLSARRRWLNQLMIIFLAVILYKSDALVNRESVVHVRRSEISILQRIYSTQSFGKISNWRLASSLLATNDDDNANRGIASGSSTSSPFDDGEDDVASDDEMEWRALLASLTMYKAAYGDLKVPQRFIVPNLAPWPKPAWGLKLGKSVYAIRSTGKYISGNQRATRRQQLDRLGFVWSARRNIDSESEETGVVTLEQIVLAASTYRRIFMNDASSSDSVADVITDNYIVPDSDPWPESVRGLPLGRQLDSLQRQCPTAVRTKLEELKILPKSTTASGVGSSRAADGGEPFSGSEFSASTVNVNEPMTDEKSSANDVRFQKVYSALKTYKELYGDLLVPQPFTVPSKNSAWPEETWGLRLGARVNAIRSQGTFVNSNPERRQLLDNLGFAWSPPKEQRGRRGRKLKSEDEGSDEQNDIPKPSNDEFADDQTTISNSDDDNYGDSLNSLFDGSFDFGPDFGSPTDEQASSSPTGASSWDFEGARIPDTKTVADLEAAAAMTKEDEYVAPQSLAESLKEATQRAIEVGVIEGLTPNQRVIKGKRDKDIPWFNDDFGDNFVFEDVVEALTTYKSIYGNFVNMSDTFVIPSPKEITGFIDDDELDESTFGRRNTNSIFDSFDTEESARVAASIAELERQGQTDQSEDLIAAEIRRLQQEVNEGLALATETETDQFITTESRNSWGEHLAGMRLGNIVSRIRDGSLEVKHLPERKAQLDAIGFDWGDPKYFLDVPFEKAMCAMYAYYLIRGDMFVYEEFAMPDEDPWPQSLSGYELGKAVKRIRELQNFFEAYHPDKVSLLRMIDFVWFSDTVALPLDPNEREMTPETLLLSALGHPDYAKMIDIPMGLPDKIMADGPFFETDDDPKLWWRKWHNWDYVKDYWYQQGRRDNAYVLRRMGYPQMADEHEAKYGIGMFKQIDELMNMLEAGIDDRSVEEKKEILEQLDFFRDELIGCTDVLPRERDKLISDIDTYIMLIMKGVKLDMMTEDELEYNFEELNGKSSGLRRDDPALKNNNSIDKRRIIDGEIYEGEEFDLEDELGFGKR